MKMILFQQKWNIEKPFQNNLHNVAGAYNLGNTHIIKKGNFEEAYIVISKRRNMQLQKKKSIKHFIILVIF